jgi:hypothetical protein
MTSRNVASLYLLSFFSSARSNLVEVKDSIQSSSSQVNFTYRDVGFDSGGWVTGLVLHETTGIVYQRTDVGGAYRSDDGGENWMWLSGYFESEDYSWETQGLAVNQSDVTGMTVLTAIGSGDPAPSSGIYKSTNGGVTWERKLSGVAANSNCFTRHAFPILAIDDARPWRVWAAMQQGLWQSMDGGESWNPVTSFNSAPWFPPGGGSGCDHGGCVTMSLVSLVPPDPTTNIVNPELASHIIVGANVLGLVFSNDDGASWIHLSVADGTLPAIANITNPWRFHRMPNGTTFVGADVVGGNTHAGTSGSVFKIEAPTMSSWADPKQWIWTDITPQLTEGWGFWGLVDTPLGFNGGLLVVASSAPDTIFTSRDGGSTWRQRNTTVTYDPPCFQPAPGQNQQLPYGRNNIVISSRNPNVWLLSTGFGVASSIDEGDNWGWSSVGLGEVVTFRCHSHPTTANWTFCGAGDLTGFIIQDGGISPKALAVFAHEPTRWAVDFGHGAVWDSFEAGSRGLSFSGGFQLGQVLGQWISWPDPLSSGPNTSMSWIPGVNSSGVLNGVPLQWVGVLQSDDDPLDVLLLTSSSDYSGKFRPWNSSTQPLSDYSGGIVRSRDGGKSWNHVQQQPNSGFVGTVWYDVNQLSLDGGSVNHRWWALSGVGLFLSSDRGETWGSPFSLCSGPSFAANVVPDKLTGAGSIFLLGAGECFNQGKAFQHTIDFGKTWTVVGNFTVRFLSPLAVHASTGRIALVATNNDDPTSHVWVSLDRGNSWTAVDLAERGHFLAPGVSGLEWDAVDSSVLYISCNGHSVVVVKFDE